MPHKETFMTFLFLANICVPPSGGGTGALCDSPAAGADGRNNGTEELCAQSCQSTFQISFMWGNLSANFHFMSFLVTRYTCKF